MTEKSLSEAVILLQSQELAPETRDTVDEAARLLAEGREDEARDLIEKAEAAVNHSAASTAEEAPQQPETAAAPKLQAIVAPIAARLTEGFTALLSEVLEEIQIRVVDQFVQRHINELDAAICDLVVVGERLQEQANEHQTRLDGALQAQEELRGSVAALQEFGQEQTEAIHRVASELSSDLAEQVEASASRFVSLEERVGALEQFVQEMPDQVSALAARLDGQNETLRLLQQRQANRVSTLNGVLDSLARLRELEIPELAAMQAVA